ncbi:MAG: hypothetical protein FWC50_11195 [Planctomycetaceae bacterium]|nr:hypothetical protein [Planctomycetaceae bacterium]
MKHPVKISRRKKSPIAKEPEETRQDKTRFLWYLFCFIYAVQWLSAGLMYFFLLPDIVHYKNHGIPKEITKEGLVLCILLFATVIFGFFSIALKDATLKPNDTSQKYWNHPENRKKYVFWSRFQSGTWACGFQYLFLSTQWIEFFLRISL